MWMIYAIQHNVTKRIYVGCTERGNRVEAHIQNLKHRTHPVPLMQKDFDTYGFDYSAYILETTTSVREWSDMERKWMHYFNTGDKRYGYNYLDKKAQKRNVSSFKPYSYEEWERLNIDWGDVSRSAFASEVENRLKKDADAIDTLSEKSRIPVSRIDGFLEDCRYITQIEMIRINKLLDLGLL